MRQNKKVSCPRYLAIFQAGLLTWIHLMSTPSQLSSVVYRRHHRPYSVGHVAELHRLPDSPCALRAQAPEAPDDDGECLLLSRPVVNGSGQSHEACIEKTQAFCPRKTQKARKKIIQDYFDRFFQELFPCFTLFVFFVPFVLFVEQVMLHAIALLSG